MSDDRPTERPEEPRTIFVARMGDAPATVPPGAPAPISPPPPVMPTETGFAPMAPRTDGNRIQPGDVLNHIFEVRRFIARGGMGEVWEGINTHTEERVAIKIMLPALAADPNVQAMFRKEARTLTRLSHPALVAYRVLAMEPQLGILYIVTDFVDGRNLSDVLSSVPRDEASVRQLLRRLAEGLRAAHELGAIHRDLTPDNVMLEDGRFDRARVIDFGIAKDLDPHKGTIVGDGFAGKLGYVAPEQLGDFGRDVGAWTDVYSLGLVALAVAAGRSPDMGATLVEAVDRRRAGVDLSAAPEGLRAVLTAMLQPDPGNRLRSMEAVIAALDGAPPPAPPPPPQPASKPRKDSAARPARDDAGTPGLNKGVLAGAGAVALLVLGGGGWLLLGGRHPPPAPATAEISGVPATPAVVAGSPVDAARAAIATALPTIPCSWLTIRSITPDRGGVSLDVGGVAGDPVAAQAALTRAIDSDKVRNLAASILPAPRNLCLPIEAFAQVRAPDASVLAIDRQDWEMDMRPDSAAFKGKKVARPIYRIYPDAAPDFALDAFSDTGVESSISNKRDLLAVENDKTNAAFSRDSSGAIVVSPDLDAKGVSGIAVVAGQGPFDKDLVAPAQPDAAWKERFVAAAKAKGWKTEMIWMRAVDNTPN